MVLWFYYLTLATLFILFLKFVYVIAVRCDEMKIYNIWLEKKNLTNRDKKYNCMDTQKGGWGRAGGGVVKYKPLTNLSWSALSRCIPYVQQCPSLKCSKCETMLYFFTTSTNCIFKKMLYFLYDFNNCIFKKPKNLLTPYLLTNMWKLSSSFIVLLFRQSTV